MTEPDTLSSKNTLLKRWLWIPSMVPVMYILIKLVCWADVLHRFRYHPQRYPPPTDADFLRAAIVFWGSLAIPWVIGIVAGIVAFRKKYAARWSFAELIIVCIPMIILFCSILWPSALNNTFLAIILLFGAHFVVGGAVVMALLNIGAASRRRTWGKWVVSALVAAIGGLYLFWLYAFVIYIDT